MDRFDDLALAQADDSHRSSRCVRGQGIAIVRVDFDSLDEVADVQRGDLSMRSRVGEINISRGEATDDQPSGLGTKRQVMSLGKSMPDLFPGKHCHGSRPLQCNVYRLGKIAGLVRRGTAGSLRQGRPQQQDGRYGHRGYDVILGRFRVHDVPWTARYPQ